MRQEQTAERSEGLQFHRLRQFSAFVALPSLAAECDYSRLRDMSRVVRRSV